MGFQVRRAPAVAIGSPGPVRPGARLSRPGDPLDGAAHPASQPSGSSQRWGAAVLRASLGPATHPPWAPGLPFSPFPLSVPQAGGIFSAMTVSSWPGSWGRALLCVAHLPVTSWVRVGAGPSPAEPLQEARTLATTATGALDDPARQRPDSGRQTRRDINEAPAVCASVRCQACFPAQSRSQASRSVCDSPQTGSSPLCQSRLCFPRSPKCSPLNVDSLLSVGQRARTRSGSPR